MVEGTPNFFKSTTMSVALVALLTASPLTTTCTAAPATLEESLTFAAEVEIVAVVAVLVAAVAAWNLPL